MNGVRVVMLLGLMIVNNVQCCPTIILTSTWYTTRSCRKYNKSLLDYGGVGHGTTSNTKAFKVAIYDLSNHGSDDGPHMIIPPGKWLTRSFNITSRFTLYLKNDVVVLNIAGFY